MKVGSKSHVYNPGDYEEFYDDINEIINRYGEETDELYQKLVLIESLYSKVPQKWILPLMEKLGEKKDIYEGLKKIPKIYRKQLNQAIEKVYVASRPIWEIFAVSGVDFRL